MSNTVTVEMSLILTTEVKEAIRTALEHTANQVVEANINCIESSTTPSGKSQKANSVAWANIKKRKLGHQTPLKAFEEQLINPDNYTIEGYDEINEFGFIITPPESRMDVILQLRDLEYELFEIPDGFDLILEANVQNELK